MTLEQLRSAAHQRAGTVAQISHRPRERRVSSSGPITPRPPVAFRTQMTMRDASEKARVTFSGVAAAYEQPYEMWDWYGPYNEVVSLGAGAKSLARTDLDTTLVLEHNQLRRIARTKNGSLQLSETSAGLEVLAPDLDMSDGDVSYIEPKIRGGLIDEMSFAFQIIRGHWSPDFTEYRIDEYDIHRGDVSIVGFGANPYTSTDMRARSARLPLRPEETQLLPLITPRRLA